MTALRWIASRVSPATRKAVVGASAATAVGIALGGLARAARGGELAHGTAGVVDGATRSAPVRLLATVWSWATTELPDGWSRLVASLDGTGSMFVELGLLASVAVALLVALGAAWRAIVLWRRGSAPAPTPGATPVPAQRSAAVARPRLRFTLPRRTPAEPVRALATAGVGRPEIARRTGLSQDAVALAMYLER